MKEFKVLMVDDEEEFIKTLDERVKMRNLDSNVAFSGEEALEILEKEAPDVMLLDLKMPGMDGMEVLRRAKAAYPGVQVVMLTGHGSDQDEAEARRLGVFDYLRKPIPIENLMKVLKAAYEKKIQDSLVAATFAEAGEYGTAQEIMDKGKKNKK